MWLAPTRERAGEGLENGKFEAERGAKRENMLRQDFSGTAAKITQIS